MRHSEFILLFFQELNAVPVSDRNGRRSGKKKAALVSNRWCQAEQMELMCLSCSDISSAVLRLQISPVFSTLSLHTLCTLTKDSSKEKKTPFPHSQLVILWWKHDCRRLFAMRKYNHTECFFFLNKWLHSCKKTKVKTWSWTKVLRK